MLGPLALWLILVARERDRWWQWTLAGGVMMVGYFAKPPVLPWIVLTLAWLAVDHARTRQWPLVLRRAGLFAAGLVVVLLPLVMRNAQVGAPLLSVTTRSAEALIQGNAVDAEPVGYGLPESQLSLLRRADGDTGTLIREILNDYDGQYGTLVYHQWQKFLYLFDVDELPNNMDIRYAERLSPVLAVLPGYGVLLPLGLAGLLLIWPALRRDPRQVSLVLLFFGALVATLIVPPVLGRYRMPLAPYWMLFSGYFVSMAWDQLQQQRAMRVALYALLLIACVIFQRAVVYNLLTFDRVLKGYQLAEFDLAQRIYTERSEPDRAADQLDIMLNEWHARGGGAFENELWTRYHEGQQRIDAVNRFIDHDQLAKAKAQLRKAEAAFNQSFDDQGQAYFDIAAIWRDLGETEPMARNLNKFLERNPDGFDAPIAKMWLEEAGVTPAPSVPSAPPASPAP